MNLFVMILYCMIISQLCQIFALSEEVYIIRSNDYVFMAVNAIDFSDLTKKPMIQRQIVERTTTTTISTKHTNGYQKT